ncbi:unnamed protein product [Cercospora beticola]|nr:unnamed protein product [Cercospora beticola]
MASLFPDATEEHTKHRATDIIFFLGMTYGHNRYQQHTKRAVYDEWNQRLAHKAEVLNSDGVDPTSKDIISFWGVCDFVVFGSSGAFLSVISPSVKAFCIMVVSREEFKERPYCTLYS